MEKLIIELSKVLDGADGNDAVAALITVLKAALDLAPTEEDRLDVINDMILFLKETEYATQ